MNFYFVAVKDKLCTVRLWPTLTFPLEHQIKLVLLDHLKSVVIVRVFRLGLLQTFSNCQRVIGL